MNIIRCTAMLLGALTLGACQTQKADEQEQRRKVNEAPPLHLGAVHQVFPEQGFATLRIIGPLPPAGSTLITHPADGSNVRVGNLQMPLDRQVRNSYLVANIRSGTVVQGDRVFLYANVAKHPGREQGIGMADGDTTSESDGTKPGTPDPISRSAVSPLPTPTATGLANGPNTILPHDEPAQEDVAAAGASAELPPNQPSTNTPKVPVKHDTPDYLNDIPDLLSDWE